MNPVKFSLALLFLFGLTCLVAAKGSLTWGDECSVAGGILSAVIRDEDESKLCNTEKGLVCGTGTCNCLPTRVWDKGYIFGLFGTGSCVVGASGPCGSDDKCVSNAKCSENVHLCICDDGYHAHDSQCVSGASSKVSGISGLAFVGMILSYYMFGN